MVRARVKKINDDKSMMNIFWMFIIYLSAMMFFHSLGLLNMITFVMFILLFLFSLKTLKWSKELEQDRQQIDSNIEHGFKDLKDFNKTKMLYEVTDGLAYTFKKGIAFDERNKFICFWRATKSTFFPKIIPYKSILSIEVYQDGVSITKTNRTSQIGGALLGGVLFGGIGAVIGGLSGKTETTMVKPKKIQLRIVINDTSNPLYDIDLMTKNGVPDKALNDARYWSGVFAAIIKQADEDESSLRQ